mgnify:CR=1 FL=1
MTDTKTIIVRVNPDLHRAARIKSIRTDKSLNEIITEKLAEWVNESEDMTPVTHHPSPTQRRKPVTA